MGCAWRVEPIAPQALAQSEAALWPSEREQLASFKFEKRRSEWLMGRWLLKQVAAEALGSAWRPEQVAIARNEAGAPELVTRTGFPGPLFLSLTHSHGWVGAAAAPWPLGVDLERVRPMPAGAWRYYLSETERDWVAEQRFGPHSDLIVWSLKEAAFKAWGGRSRSLLPLKLEAVEGDTCWLAYDGEQVGARFAVLSGMCVAVATAPAGVDWLNELDLQALLPVADDAKRTGIVRLEGQ